MKDSFQPLTDSFTPDPPQSLWNKATTTNLQGQTDLLARGAQLGQAVNKPVQAAAGALAEGGGYLAGRFPNSDASKEVPLPKWAGSGSIPAAAIPGLLAGTALGTMGEANIPQNRLGAAAFGVSQGLQRGPALMKAIAGKLVGETTSVGSLPSEPALGLGQEAQPLSSQSQAPVNALPSSRNVGSSPAVSSSSSSSLPPELESVKTQNGPMAQEWAKARQSFSQAQLSEHNARKVAFENGTIDQFESDFSSGKHPTAKMMEDAFNKMQSVEKNIPNAESLYNLNSEQVDKLASTAQAAEKVKPNPPGNMAQLISAKGGRSQITPSMAQYAIDHPEVLDKDTSVAQATKEYVDAVPGLKGKTADLAQKLDKTVLRPGDYDEAINQAGRDLKNGELNPQTALTGLQSINKALRDKQYTSGMDKAQITEISKVKDGVMDYLQNNGAPKIREAAKNLFEAHVKEAFSGLIPKNKFGSPDALKTMIGAGQLGTAGSLAVGGLATGHPIAGAVAAAPIAANALLSSPAVLGQLIRESGAMRNPANLQAIGKMGVPISNMLSDTGAQQ